METKIIIESKENLIEFLPKTKLSGYIWMVEHQKPIIHNKEALKIDELNYRKNPHNKIQEAYLYDGTNSYHIKNIDGEEKVFIHKIADYTENGSFKTKILKFPSHIFKDKNLTFKQVYELKPSLSGADFKTWQPIVRLFTGFSNQPTKKD
jgi:CRISPR type III-associated protein (TIGR04423 family)